MATALGIAGANTLIRFDTASPGTIVSSIPITGLATGDVIAGLDFRPATGQLYGLGGGSRLYVIDPNTAAATQVGSSGAFTLTGSRFGFDFNPTVDRIRLTSDADQNLRLNPGNGTLVATDGTLAYAGGDPNAGANPSVVASAYTNSFGGSTATTLYDIDSTTDTLVIQNPPNSGTLNTVGGLGVDAQGEAGFDIQALPGGGNLAFAALTTDGASSALYTINLATGLATPVGNIGTSATLVRGLAIVPEITPTAVLYGINAADNSLVRINSNNPSTVISSTPITGLATGDLIVALDFRPATGQLYGLGGGSRLYTINPTTAAATQVGVDGAFTLSGTRFGFDFNPTVDRIRVTSDADQDLRLNPNDGTLAATDGTLAYASGDPNVGANPSVVASAYINSFAGATTTTLYDIDSVRDVLATQNPPNSGTLNTVGGLGINVLDVAGFDIQALPGGGNLAFAALTIDGSSSALYTIDLTTGAATQVGSVPIGGAAPLLLGALAVAPFGSFRFSAPTYSVGEDGLFATITVNRALGSEGIATVRLTTSDGTATSDDYVAFDRILVFGPGETTQTIQIPIVDDALDEADRTINLTLASPTGGAVLGTPSAAVLTIVDDDTTPVAVADAYAVSEDASLTVAVPGVLANDTDGDGDPLTALLVSGPANGTLVLNADGSFTYTPNAQFNGVDSFTYRAGDGVNEGNVATVTLTVSAVNDAPVAVPDSYTTAEDTPLIVGLPGVLANDTDGDGDALTAVLVSGPANGTLVLNADGSFTYTPNPGISGADGFSYRAFDGAGNSNVATVSLVITAVNDVPVAGADAYTTGEGVPLVVAVPGVLANDADADGDSLIAALVSGPAHGVVSLNPNGSFTYTPDAGFDGPDSFTYRASDGVGSSNVATVSLTVTPGSDPVQPGPVQGDYDGDGKADLAVYLTTYGAFGIRPSSGGPDRIVPFGNPGPGLSLPAPGDYDGDGITDLAVYLTTYGAFGIRPSSGGPDRILPFGNPGAGLSLPAPGDYDGDGKTDLAVYLTTFGAYGIRPSSGGPDRIVPFGNPGAGLSLPAPGDYDGDRVTDLAVYLTTYGAFGIRPSGGGADRIVPFGNPGEGLSLPAPGDYDGDRVTDLAVYLTTYGAFGIRPSSGGPDRIVPFGNPGVGLSLPAPGDYSGTGRDQIAVYLASTGAYGIRPDGGQGDLIVPFGNPGIGRTIPATVAVDQALAEIGPNVAALVAIPDSSAIAEFVTPSLARSARKKGPRG